MQAVWPAGGGFEFRHATPSVIFGAGSLARLADVASENACARCLAILDPHFADHPIRDRLAALVAPADLVCHVIPDAEPGIASVEMARTALVAAQADLIVAIGGGSAIDTAKSALINAANPGAFADLIAAGPAGLRAWPGLFVAVPTTAGTGSEVSETTIIDVPGTVYKAHLRSVHMAPQVAILDPELGVSAPRGVTIASGFDALTHAVEAYTSRAVNPLTDALALSGAALLAHNLRLCADRPDDLDARGACLIGSAQAGIAFNSAHLGISHAIAGALGALHHVPHGLANALALPWAMAFNAPAMAAKDATLGALFGAPDAASGISRLRHDLGFDQGLDEHVTGDLDAVARAAMTSGQIAMNPRRPSLADMRALLEAMRRPTGGARPRLDL
ncbi:MAG: iron-containing alcohol dehydrogenase [Rhodobacteraceae bacterium]|nr:iron-containing alcohol dehydrogenase [Paracoccaceae bacterium]